MAGDKNLTLEAALQLEYPAVLEKLLSGDIHLRLILLDQP